jgi:trk system potassium uptake protein TrkH
LALYSLVVEGAGILIFYFRWSATGEVDNPLWTAVFQSVSAFNNCGMDLMGGFKSLIGFQGDAVTLLTTAFLIIIGATGYIIFADMFRNRRFYRLSLDSKIVVVTSLVLLAIGTAFYIGTEYSNPATLGPLDWPRKVLVAFFQSATPRSGGFTAVDIGSLGYLAFFFTMLLMFIGGATGSTGGGVKVNTWAFSGLPLSACLKAEVM